MEREEHPLVETTDARPAPEASPFLSSETGGEVPLEPWPMPESAETPQADAPSEAHEETPPEAASSSSELPRKEAGGDRSWVPFAVGGGLLLLVLIGVVGLWQTRSQLSAARAEIAALKESARRAELLQARSAVIRARAELEPLKEVLPSDLVAEVQRADGILAAVADRLKGAR